MRIKYEESVIPWKSESRDACTLSLRRYRHAYADARCAHRGRRMSENTWPGAGRLWPTHRVRFSLGVDFAAAYCQPGISFDGSRKSLEIAVANQCQTVSPLLLVKFVCAFITTRAFHKIDNIRYIITNIRLH